MFALQLSDRKVSRIPEEYRARYKGFPDYLLRKLDTRSYEEQKQSSLEVVRNSVPENQEVYHENYIEYLGRAWNNHYGVIVSPDKFWYTILTELAGHIKSNDERYRKHFTRTESGKEDIIIGVGGDSDFPMDEFIDELKERVPMNTKLVLPEFSTTTSQDHFAACSAFCDAVSVYYNYLTFLCDIPSIQIWGTKDDWKLISANLSELTMLDLARPYLEKVKTVIDEIVNNFSTPNPDFWRKMFFVRHCGSGHQEEVYGWITSLFMKTSEGTKLENFPSQVSVVPYKNLSSDTEYKLHTGLFSSKFQEDGFLVPEFSHVVLTEPKK